MTNEEAKVFLDNLKICIDEHPIVADWLVEIADRKTEPSSSEIPNSSTISKMEQVDKPTTQKETQNSNLTFEKADERCKGCNHYKLTCDLFSEICNYEPKDEPQTERSE